MKHTTEIYYDLMALVTWKADCIGTDDIKYLRWIPAGLNNIRHFVVLVNCSRISFQTVLMLEARSSKTKQVAPQSRVLSTKY